MKSFFLILFLSLTAFAQEGGPENVVCEDSQFRIFSGDKLEFCEVEKLRSENSLLRVYNLQLRISDLQKEQATIQNDLIEKINILTPKGYVFDYQELIFKKK